MLQYIKRVNNLCLYRFDHIAMSPSISFPKAQTVTLINCGRAGISQILTPTIFPNLRQIHYLSAHPGDVGIYTRFPKNVSWLFPNVKYPFYNCMIEAGHGRVENRMIPIYLHHLTKRGNYVSMEVNLPGYGICNGDWYRDQFYRYISQPRDLPKHTDIVHDFSTLYQPDPNPFDYEHPYFDCGYTDANTSVQQFLKKRMEDEFFDHIMNQCDNEETKNKKL